MPFFSVDARLRSKAHPVKIWSFWKLDYLKISVLLLLLSMIHQRRICSISIILVVVAKPLRQLCSLVTVDGSHQILRVASEGDTNLALKSQLPQWSFLNSEKMAPTQMHTSNNRSHLNHAAIFRKATLFGNYFKKSHFCERTELHLFLKDFENSLKKICVSFTH